MALMGILTVLLQAGIIHVSHHQIVDSLSETTNIPGCNLTALKKQNNTHKKYISLVFYERKDFYSPCKPDLTYHKKIRTKRVAFLLANDATNNF